MPPIQASVPRRATSAKPTGSTSTATREHSRSMSLLAMWSASAASSICIGTR